MAYCFGDGFDCYATAADAIAGYWDSGATTNFTLAAGRFAGSQCVRAASSAVWLVKSSAVNDAVHHIVCAVQQTAVLSGTTLGMYLQLSDAATNQVCIVFRSDGAILLTSATPVGTVLATYTGAVTAQSTWFAFEFEVVISATVGRFRARKNGNTADDFDSGATLNTRPGANSYANKLSLGMNLGVSFQLIDDLLWRSDASSVPFVGDIRCYTRMPASDASVQFARAPNPAPVTYAVLSSTSDATGTARYSPITAPYTGTVGSIVVQVNTGFTGNMKCSIFTDSSGGPGAVLGSATTLTNPVTGANTFTFGTPVAVSKGVSYWFGFSHDVTVILSTGTTSIGKSGAGVSYASFPAAGPVVASGQPAIASTVNITPTISSEFVNEAQQDGTTTYVYDSTVGHADLYNIASIAATPASTIVVTTRAFAEKLDAGLRQVTVQVKSGATTVQATPVSLATNFGWIYRTDTTDPATSTAWTPAAVNSLQVGPLITG